SMSCTARSMTTPTFDILGGNGPTRVIAIERISSSDIACLMAATAGLKRSTWPTIKVTSAGRAAATMSRPSSAEDAIGVSARTRSGTRFESKNYRAWHLLRHRTGLNAAIPGQTIRPDGSGALIIVLDANDVVLAEIAAGLDFDQLQRNLAWIFHPMGRADRNIDRFVLMHGLDEFVDGHARRAAHHDPVLGAMV